MKNRSGSRYPCLPPAEKSCRRLSYAAGFGYTTSVANRNTRLHKLPSAGVQEALKLRAERLSFSSCSARDFPSQRTTLREGLPRRCFRLVASQLTLRCQLLSGSPV